VGGDYGDAGRADSYRLLMVRLPAGWIFHPPVGSGPNRGLVRQPNQVQPIGAFRSKIRGVPLQPGQAQTVISAAGGGTVTLGPTGLGNIWYPTQVTVSTTSGVNDSSTFNLFLGPAGVPITMVGTLFPGGAGTIALAIPSMSPGQYLIGQWAGGNAGDLAAMNVIGTMDALSAGRVA
jgi:hypothetical protein